ncbi:AsnC family transcriptional regulator [Prauserella shujinwangii]|uniref:AsnC family transcriptional regulator n=1 Tax=Prauserella shujinwangii TaxID=1453103 RepID=A0A2T0LZG8_9PSEU|nr:Lrp/AsnC family transcriptional regulator [Prauserella shujinwangii]PRX49511.1 AsnC family transcriptional regulator [Prauserella shujinwangii]
MPRPIPLDDIDRHLLTLIQADSTRGLHELGEEVGLSASAVQRRLTRYRTSGLLRGEVAVLDPRVLGGAMPSIVLVALDRESAALHAAFHARMLAEPRVQQCYSIAGQWDYVVVHVTEGLAESRALSERLFLGDPNVRRYDTLPAVETIKRGLALPLPEE